MTTGPRPHHGRDREGSGACERTGKFDPARHFLSIADWPPDRLRSALDMAARFRLDPYWAGRPLEGRSVALVFAKSSTRTRVSFEVGIAQLGGHSVFLASRDIQLGRGEPVADTARVLSRYVQAIMIRTFSQEDVEQLARYGSIPVINGLTDFLHPCQVLADLATVEGEFPSRDLASLRVAWIGDGNNMANSWLNAAAQLGFSLGLACPAGYEPDRAILDRARASDAEVSMVRDPREVVEGADVITTDVWASMGQEEEAADRNAAFQGYTVDEELMARAAAGAIFLHCLPAHRGEEVSCGVLEGPWSRVWDQAENRLHAQKAIMTLLLG